MQVSQEHVDSLRRVVAALRHNSRRVGRVATRFNRLGLYVFDLLIWSRVEAARRGLISLELPEASLARKGVSRSPPTLRVRGPHGRHEHFNQGFAAVHALLFANLQLPDVLSAHYYALPGPAFRGIYLWDSAFISRIWHWWDRQVAADILRAVVALRDGPRLQHVVADFMQSAFTQPPLIAWSLARLCESTNPAALEAMYSALKDYHHWLNRNRRTSTGLFAWQHAYESGLDNSPRFASRDEARLDRLVDRDACDFSTYMILHGESLAEIAEKLGDDAQAGRYRDEAEAIRVAINRRLWHAEDGLYYDRDRVTGHWARCGSIASLLPLWAGIPDSAQADRLLQHIMDPRRFATRIPLPSVARDDPAFERDMWRGPVWINVAYAVLSGMKRHSFDREVAELAWRLCDGVYRVFANEHNFWEFYDPDAWHTDDLARKRGNWWKRFTLGSGPQREFVGWSGLVNTIVIELLFGLASRDGRRTLRPTFPPAAEGAVLRLSVPVEDLLVEVAIESTDRMQGLVQDCHGLRTFTAGFGETIDLDALLETSPSAQV